jgi:hypothetical protein
MPPKGVPSENYHKIPEGPFSKVVTVKLLANLQ